MRRATLAEKLGLAASLLAAGTAGGAGCAGDHHVSPWGQRSGPTLEAFLGPGDLDAELGMIDAETRALSLDRTDEIRTELPPRGSGRPAVVRGYRGRDVTGRAVHAVRVATPRGVVLALGPHEAGDLDRRGGTELVPALATSADGAGVAFQSGSDLNGDGAPDVVLRNDAGELSIWHFGEMSSGRYTVTMITPPTRGIDVDGDGHTALWGEVPVDPRETIGPHLTDVATFADGAYSDGTAAAHAWHAREAAPQPAPPTTPPTPPTKVSDAVRLRVAVERAWHQLLAGEPKEGILKAFRREPVPASLRAEMDAHDRTLAAITPR